MDAPSYPGAVAPERIRTFDSFGVGLRLSEWGDPAAPPIVLCHGMFDHGRGFDTLAPLLAQRFRVVAIDARGHGDSAWLEVYPWVADVLDVVHVLRSFGKPVHLLGHSRGGGLAGDAAARAPGCVRQLVNLDGFGPPPEGFEAPGFAPRSAPTVAKKLEDFLQWRRGGSHVAERSYPELDHLIARRSAQNPRLSQEWLRYLTFHGARRTAKGWTWKADLRVARGVNPFRPDWACSSWHTLDVPFLAVIGSEPDTWGPLPEGLLAPRLARIANLTRAVVQGAGHFIHMEQPRATADLLLDWLDR